LSIQPRHPRLIPTVSGQVEPHLSTSEIDTLSEKVGTLFNLQCVKEDHRIVFDEKAIPYRGIALNGTTCQIEFGTRDASTHGDVERGIRSGERFHLTTTSHIEATSTDRDPNIRMSEVVISESKEESISGGR